MEKRMINYPGHGATGLGGRIWSPGIKKGPWLFLSGVTSVDYEQKATAGIEERSAMTPPRIDPVKQWHQVLSNIKSLVEEAGGTMADIVMANVFVTDMHYYTDYEYIRAEYFVEPYPVSTAVEVGRLVSPNWCLEIECIAYIED